MRVVVHLRSSTSIVIGYDCFLCQIKVQENKNWAKGGADAVQETLLDSVTNILYAKEDVAEEEGH